MKIFLFICICIFILTIFVYYSNSKQSRRKFTNSKQSNLYLITVYPYQYNISGFKGVLTKYFTMYKNQSGDWKTALKKAMTSSYQEVFNSSIIPDDSEKFVDDIVNSNNILNTFKISSYTPSLLSSFFYTYKIVDPTNSYYIKNIPVKTLQNGIDLALQLKTGFYGDDTTIQLLDKINPNTFRTDISNTIFPNFFYSPVTFIYFDPMDIYLHPSRYTLNKGVGIMDSTQPTYTLYVEKDQLQYLNRLLKNSSLDVPMIHAFFRLPNYKLIWDDQFADTLLNTYENLRQIKSIKDSFYGSISSFVSSTLNKTIDLSNLFNTLPSTYYWIITYISLFDPTNNDAKSIFSYAKSPSYDPTICYNQCDLAKDTCKKENEGTLIFCLAGCDSEPQDPNYQNCMTNCGTDKADNDMSCDNSDSDCKSNCQNRGTSVTYCTKNSDCSTNACGLENASDNAPYICCSGLDTFLFTDYCKDLSNGQKCMSNFMCNSGNCKGSFGGLSGICS